MSRKDNSALLFHVHDHERVECGNNSHDSDSTTAEKLMVSTSQECEDAKPLENGVKRSGTYSSCLSTVRQRFYGWKGGFSISMVADAIVLLVLLSSTLAVAFAYPRNGANAILMDGDCSETKTTQTWLHLLINVLSTILLSTSSYAMQCLGSPTRTEVDEVHAKGKSMNIGVPSFTNLFRVGKRRLVLYIALLLTSLPIHLLANSTIFETTAANSYILAVVNEKFVTTPLEDLDTVYSYRIQGYNSIETIMSGNETGGSPMNEFTLGVNTTSLLKGLQPKMERLDNRQCIEAYSDPLSQTRKNVIAVLDLPPPSYNNSNFIYLLTYQSVDFCQECKTFENWTDPAVWTCAFTHSQPGLTRSCDTSKAASEANLFAIDGSPVSYCLSEPADGYCQLLANIPIMAVVVVCAFLKTIILYASLKTLPSGILATIGDAIASFLHRPEPSTSECSLLERDDIRQVKWKPGQPFPKPWKSSTLSARWGQAPSFAVWTRTIVFMATILIVVLSLFGIGFNKLKPHDSNSSTDIIEDVATPPVNGDLLVQMGFGTVNVNSLLPLPDMTSRDNVIGHVLLVNAPQLMLSVIYFAYNTCWTNMLVAREWASFGRQRKSLRTSSPAGAQRHTYFLSIPYRFGVPLQLCSAVLHWLLSQSFFLARLDVYSATPFVEQPPAVINTVGYSLLALLIFVTLWTTMLIALVAFGVFGRLKSPMTIVGASSLAISAACHPPPTEDRPECKPLMWGVIDTMEHEDGTRHCSFSSSDVSSPETFFQRERGDDLNTKAFETRVLFA